MNDKELLGDFQRFYQNHVTALRNYFRRLGVLRSEQVDDLVQDTFFESYRCWANLRSEKAARAWLFTIGRRQLGRAIKKGRHLVLDFSDDLLLMDTACTLTQPEQDLHAQRVCQIILKCLVQVTSDAKRQALAAYFLEEKSFREIEGETGINLSTLTTWCSRFRSECLKSIDGHYGEPTSKARVMGSLWKKGVKL